jgi:hypothetical protein
MLVSQIYLAWAEITRRFRLLTQPRALEIGPQDASYTWEINQLNLGSPLKHQGKGKRAGHLTPAVTAKCVDAHRYLSHARPWLSLRLLPGLAAAAIPLSSFRRKVHYRRTELRPA